MLTPPTLVMRSHKATCLRWCSLISTLFPQVLASGLLTWAQYTAVKQLYLHYYLSGYSLAMMVSVSVLYLLSLYTYHKVILVGAGSPSDFSLLRLAPKRDHSSPYGPAYNNTNEAYQYEEGYEHNSNPSLGLNSNPSLGSSLGPSLGSSVSPKSNLLGSVNSPKSDNSEYSVTPPQWLLTTHYIENNSTSYRSCTTCHVWKPDRCHHCSVCRRCFLKMDHHCPWFACCIGFRNHKFFIQSLIYITLFSAVVLALSLSMLYGFFVDGQYEEDYLSLSLVFLMVLSVVFFIAVGCFTAFSVYLVLRNTTTIEFQNSYWNGPDAGKYEYDSHGNRQKLGHIYDLGIARNWTSTMGSHWYQWCFPVSVTSTAYDNFNNGLNFLVDEDVYQKHVYNAQLQYQLNNQLREYRDRIRGVD